MFVCRVTWVGASEVNSSPSFLALSLTWLGRLSVFHSKVVLLTSRRPELLRTGVSEGSMLKMISFVIAGVLRPASDSHPASSDYLINQIGCRALVEGLFLGWSPSSR